MVLKLLRGVKPRQRAVQLIQKAQLQVGEGLALEASASLGYPHAKGCSYYFLTPHFYQSLYHLPLLPFILTYATTFPSKVGSKVRNLCSCTTQES